jgi:hypothetical protein
VAKLSGGLRFLDAATPDEIEKEVRSLINDAEAEKAWAEAATLKLPTWKKFGSATSKWVELASP